MQESRLVLVTVAADVQAIAGLSEHLAADRSISAARCPAVRQDVVNMCRRLAPCILIVDAPFVEGIDAGGFSTEADIGNTVKALIVVDGDDPARSRAWLKLGFAGTLRRDSSADLLRRALHAVAGGEIWAPRAVVSGLIKEWVAQDSPRQLTAREAEILNFIGNGYTNREIADALFITRETVRWHVRSIYAKLGASDRESAIRYVNTNGETILPKPVSTVVRSPAARKVAY